MNKDRKSVQYRKIIDDLVDMCHKGQGSIGSSRVRKGIWNINANKKSLKDQYQINQLLKKLSSEEKDVLAKMLDQEVVLGVFETLKVLESNNISPFENGYEGSAYEDFIGRVDRENQWEWPK